MRVRISWGTAKVVAVGDGFVELDILPSSNYRKTVAFVRSTTSKDKGALDNDEKIKCRKVVYVKSTGTIEMQ